MTTALASWVPVCQTWAADTGTGRASGRQRVSVPRQVNAGSAALPSAPIKVGSAISLDLSLRSPRCPACSASVSSATTGTRRRHPASAASAACSLPRPAA